MRTMICIVLVVTSGLFLSCVTDQKSSLSMLSETMPGDSAVVFGKGIISTDDFEFAITFTPDMDELFFTRRKAGGDNEIYTMKLTGEKWSAPEPTFFKPTSGWDFEPHIDPSGERLYFGSTRPLNDSLQRSGLHQWYCESIDTGWSQPVPLETPFVDRSVIMYLTGASNGNLYFTTGEKGDGPEDWGIYCAPLTSEGYKEIRRMGEEINETGAWIAHSYIAPDESYMIYDFESDSGYGDTDLYISFNNEGAWSTPVNLGPEVNTDEVEMCGSVSPDGKFLFFHRGGEGYGDIYWIDFRRIKEKLLGRNWNYNATSFKQKIAKQVVTVDKNKNTK